MFLQKKQKKRYEEKNIKKEEKMHRNNSGTKNSTSQKNNYNYNYNYNFDIVIGDSFAKIICKTNCLDKIEVIEEMLSCSKEDIHLDEHFSE